jgi:hypothetical protein
MQPQKTRLKAEVSDPEKVSAMNRLRRLGKPGFAQQGNEENEGCLQDFEGGTGGLNGSLSRLCSFYIAADGLWKTLGFRRDSALALECAVMSALSKR